MIFFFFNDTATTEIYTLSLHDALPISSAAFVPCADRRSMLCVGLRRLSSWSARRSPGARSEEHTSELQSQSNLVCRLLLEKKKVSEGARQLIHDHILDCHVSKRYLYLT